MYGGAIGNRDPVLRMMHQAVRGEIKKGACRFRGYGAVVLEENMLPFTPYLYQNPLLCTVIVARTTSGEATSSSWWAYIYPSRSLASEAASLSTDNFNSLNIIPVHITTEY